MFNASSASQSGNAREEYSVPKRAQSLNQPAARITSQFDDDDETRGQGRRTPTLDRTQNSHVVQAMALVGGAPVPVRPGAAAAAATTASLLDVGPRRSLSVVPVLSQQATSTQLTQPTVRRIVGETPTDANSSKAPVRRSRANPNEALHGLVSDGMGRGGPLSAEEQRQVMRQQGPRAHIKDVRTGEITESYVRQMPRRWKVGDVYAPRDLSPAEMMKWRKGRAPNKDVVDMLGFNPLDNYRVRFLRPPGICLP
jgi:hypothetical protein